ncbi:single-stranded DNA-binding protein [Chitinophaga defluvii]|uniref:Single-stranded DNA-binding protein n=1 Tax=Chitinophaga defluvii TaxID=3163343 RepID=A0ABV2SYC4_9BACT
MIKLQLIGNLGRNAIKREANGKSVLSFTVASTERFKNAQGVLQERTTWVDCALWERDNLAPYLLQGQQVYLEGTPSVDAYTNHAGEPAATLRLRVLQIQLLGSRRDEEKHKAEAEGVMAARPLAVPVVEEVADDLPF